MIGSMSDLRRLLLRLTSGANLEQALTKHRDNPIACQRLIIAAEKFSAIQPLMDSSSPEAALMMAISLPIDVYLFSLDEQSLGFASRLAHLCHELCPSITAANQAWVVGAGKMLAASDIAANRSARCPLGFQITYPDSESWTPTEFMERWQEYISRFSVR
jgi:hypothetical protein